MGKKKRKKREKNDVNHRIINLADYALELVNFRITRNARACIYIYGIRIIFFVTNHSSSIRRTNFLIARVIYRDRYNTRIIGKYSYEYRSRRKSLDHAFLVYTS